MVTYASRAESVPDLVARSVEPGLERLGLPEAVVVDLVSTTNHDM